MRRRPKTIDDDAYGGMCAVTYAMVAAGVFWIGAVAVAVALVT